MDHDEVDAELRLIRDHLTRHPVPELEGYAIPADYLAAWLFMHHEHPTDDGPMVDSHDLEDFIRSYLRVA